jgi:hypothetical protein
MAGEAGEVADLLKKHLGHKHTLDPGKLALELGDVLWYVSALSFYTGHTLAEIAALNIEKLRARYPNGFDPERSLHRDNEAGRPALNSIPFTSKESISKESISGGFTLDDLASNEPPLASSQGVDPFDSSGPPVARLSYGPPTSLSVDKPSPHTTVWGKK